MDLLNIDKETLKAAFSESLHENRAFFEEIVKKVIKQEKDVEQEKEAKLLALADKIMNENDNLFKRLAL
jgi:DNA gyrase/topoisomerase IV subunit B